MKPEKREFRRWRTAGVLALGVVIGVVLLAPPAGAHFLASIDHIWHHIKPKADKRYSPVKNLPAGWTLRGNYAASGDAKTGEAHYLFGELTFQRPLASAPTAHWIQEGGAPTAECPGSVAAPKAAPGHLCIYENDSVNVLARHPFFTTRWGSSSFFDVSNTDAASWSYGTWAVTAPPAGAAVVNVRVQNRPPGS